MVYMPLIFRIVVLDECTRAERAELSVVELDKSVSACSLHGTIWTSLTARALYVTSLVPENSTGGVSK